MERPRLRRLRAASLRHPARYPHRSLAAELRQRAPRDDSPRGDADTPEGCPHIPDATRYLQLRLSPDGAAACPALLLAGEEKAEGEVKMIHQEENDEMFLGPLAERLCISWISYQAGVQYQTMAKQLKDVPMGAIWMNLAHVVFDYMANDLKVRDAEKRSMKIDVTH